MPWLAVLAAVAYIGVPWFAVRTENTDRRMGPLPFITWFLAGYIGPPMVAVYGAPMLDVSVVGALTVALLVACVSVFLVFRRFVWRTRDAGYPRAAAMLAVVPLVTIGCAVFLTTVPSVPGDDIPGDGD